MVKTIARMRLFGYVIEIRKEGKLHPAQIKYLNGLKCDFALIPVFEDECGNTDEIKGIQNG